SWISRKQCHNRVPDVLVDKTTIFADDRTKLIAGVCTAASVLGGLFGLWIGMALFEEVGRPVLEFYGKAEKFQEFADWFGSVGVEAVLFAAISPFPYKVITIASGVAIQSGAHLPIWAFIGASIVGRGLQFFIVAGLFWYFGEKAKALIEKHMTLVATVFAILLIGGFVAVRMLA
ncbi:MAG: hypothetical protein AAF439_13825, partial [Pseudomonadota bacterium]